MCFFSLINSKLIYSKWRYKKEDVSPPPHHRVLPMHSLRHAHCWLFVLSRCSGWKRRRHSIYILWLSTLNNKRALKINPCWIIGRMNHTSHKHGSTKKKQNQSNKIDCPRILTFIFIKWPPGAMMDGGTFVTLKRANRNKELHGGGLMWNTQKRRRTPMGGNVTSVYIFLLKTKRNR